MNLDQQLRDVLGHEAELQNPPVPDVRGLISGGMVRQRRRRTARIALGVGVAVLVAAGAYGVTRIGGESKVEPATPSSTRGATSTATPSGYTDAGPTLEPGTYGMSAGLDDSGAEIRVDYTVDGAGWQVDNYPVLYDPAGGTGNGGFAVYRPLGLSAGTGCIDSRLNTNLGQTPQRLAQQLTRLPQSTVLQAPTPVQILGRDAVHVQLRIRNDCVDTYRVAFTADGGHGITYDPARPVVIDFWVMGVSGVPVVVETWHQEGVSSQMVDRLARTRDSVTFTAGG